MIAQPSRTLLYLAYGNDRAVHEATFAVLSALRFVLGRPDYRLLVYTDRPQEFADLPVATVPLEPALLEQWAGPGGYVHRRKLMAIADALHRHPDPTVFLDGDTWLIRSPDALFGRVGPGRAVLHLPETRLLESDSDAKRALSAHVATRDFATRGRGPVVIDPNAMMWNSGVVGIHPDDAHLVQEALDLTDAIWAEHRGSHDLEQFALGQALESAVQLSSADDVVFHYWPPHLRRPFLQRLPVLLERTRHLPPAQRAATLHRERPRSTGVRRVKMLIKKQLWRLGLQTRGPRTSG